MRTQQHIVLTLVRGGEGYNSFDVVNMKKRTGFMSKREEKEGLRVTPNRMKKGRPIVQSEEKKEKKERLQKNLLP